MRYSRINTDENARPDIPTCDLWYKHRLAFAGNFEDSSKHKRYDKDLAKLLPGDGCSGTTLCGVSLGIDWSRPLWMAYSAPETNTFYLWRNRTNIKSQLSRILPMRHSHANA